DAFFARFPTGKIIGLHRDTEACARSFLDRKALGRGSINHWAPPRNGIWRGNIWDPVYPTYPQPAGAEEDPDAAKLDAIRRYVREYNASLAELAAHRPQSVMLVRTEELGESAAQQRIFAFIGKAGKPSQRIFNAGSIADGREFFRF
ncbi:MAG TPA: hypothetical protein VET85_17220, partial [Stellaceae bacterium]|nr:hypothetical protein [Stellaceae bacterium]